MAGIILMVLLGAIFIYIPHASFRLSFFVLQVVVIVDIVVRLWQKAACMSWLENRPADITTPVYAPPAPVTLSTEPTPEQL
jgi:hypothetical protein